MRNLFLFVITYVIYSMGVTLLGLCIGWIVGLFLGKTILEILACIGIKGFKMWQVGAILGFLASFFGRKWFNVDLSQLYKK